MNWWSDKNGRCSAPSPPAKDIKGIWMSVYIWDGEGKQVYTEEETFFHLGLYCTTNLCIQLHLVYNFSKGAIYVATENCIMVLYQTFRSGCQVYFLLLSRYFFFFWCVLKLVCVSARQSMVYQAFLLNITG